MKKLFIMAAMIVASSSAFAQDLKSVLKSKDYAEAQGQLQSCLSTLSNDEKAKAYHKLVELSLNKANHEISIIQEKGVHEIRKIYPGGHDWNVWRPCFTDFAQMIFR